MEILKQVFPRIRGRAQSARLRRFLAIALGVALLVSSSLSSTPTIARVSFHPAQRLIQPIILSQAPDPTHLIEQGTIAYQSGQIRQAIGLWSEAAELFSNSGDALGSAMVAGNLALAHQQLGQSQEANKKLSAGKALLDLSLIHI